MLGGLGLLFAISRRAAAWGLIALLVAVFPANIYMATNSAAAGAEAVAPAIRWPAPLQALFIWWLYCVLSPVQLPEDSMTNVASKNMPTVASI